MKEHYQPGVSWQPMETAPRDGTDILAFFASYYQGRGGHHVVVWMDFTDAPGWYSAGSLTMHGEPDCWMPLDALPEPPAGCSQRMVAERRVSSRKKAAFSLGCYRVLMMARRKWTMGFTRERELLMIRLPGLYVTISDSRWRA